jgi:predicted transport protein
MTDSSARLREYLQGKNEAASALFLQFRLAALEAGEEVEERVSKSIVASKRKRTFATAYVKGKYLECSIDLLRQVKHLHLKAAFHTTKKVVTHRFTLEPGEEIDADIRSWLKEAFAEVGGGTEPILRNAPYRPELRI